ncbi:MAG: rhomboid family intramembrane serine protease [Phycisphaerales bacterium]|nr:rhomboid family intramembrane serine protease [Phycisphaerales bacterium]
MGIQDRDYNRSSYGIGGNQSGGGGRVFMRNPGWSVTIWLIVINLTIHFLAVIVFASAANQSGLLYRLGQLTIFDAFQRLEVWRLLTFQFLHDPNSLLHVGFNMFGLWIFGPMVEDYLGRKKYLAFYLICGLSGGMLFAVLNVLGAYTPLNLLRDGFHTPLIGASAGVFGVIMACAFVSPNTVIRLLFPPIPLKMRTLAYGYVGLAAFNLLIGSRNAGGEAAHIGGAVAGFFFIRNSHLLLDFFDVFGDSRKGKSKRKRSRGPKPKKYDKGVPSDEDVDRILDKVSREGLGSLSEKEKKSLNKASKGED